jgi:cysteine-rich repeat protein
MKNLLFTFALLGIACVERLPGLGPEATYAIIEGTVRGGVDGTNATAMLINARVEIAGVGLLTSDDYGFFRLPRLPTGAEARQLEFVVYEPGSSLDAPPVGRRIYQLPAHAVGQVLVDIAVGARGSINGRVSMPNRPHHGGVIVFVDGIPGADDLSGPDGSFFIHGVPAGEAQIRFMFEDYRVNPSDGLTVSVTGNQATNIAESIELLEPLGESVLAPVQGQIEFDDGVSASELELVLAPLLARPWSGAPAADVSPVKTLSIPADGKFYFTLDYPEPYTLTLRSRAESAGLPLRQSRRFYVTPGTTGLTFSATLAAFDNDGDGTLDTADLDGDGISDAEDDDPDGDGCLDEPELTKNDALSCGDLDGDGVADGFDADDDGDGEADLEEVTAGADGRTSDPNQTDSEQNAALQSPDGNLVLENPDASLEQLQPSSGHSIFSEIAAHSEFFGGALISPVYALAAVESGGVFQLQLHGYQGTNEGLRIVIIEDCSGACDDTLVERILPGETVDCVGSARGRKVCPAEALRREYNGATLVWIHASASAPPTALCGDGVVQPGEECDDGDADDYNGCDRRCVRARCGDAVVQTGETCDDGNLNNADSCTRVCQMARCGDGISRLDRSAGEADYEACDDGNDNNQDSCTTACQIPACGDGFLNTDPERCDDGNQDESDACLNNCTVATCGDSRVHQGVEACDDADDNNENLCRNDCTFNFTGQAANRAAVSCKSIMDNGLSQGNDVYWINPEGGHSSTSFQVYCLMSEDGGGWTLILKTNGNSTAFSYDSRLWTTAQLHQIDETNMSPTEHKNAAYDRLTFEQILVGMKVGDTLNWLSFNYRALSLFSIIDDDQYLAINNSTRGDWLSLIDGSVLQEHCNRIGFNNIVGGTLKARIGIIANEQNNCGNPDSVIGLGTGHHCDGPAINSGNAACYYDSNNPNNSTTIAAFGFLMVR